MNITRRIEIERRIAIIRVLQELINICEQRLQIRRWWVRPHLSVHLRETYGAYHSIFKYFKLEDHEEFYRFIGMTVAQFEAIYELVKDSLTKYSNRGCLPSELRLAAVLNYLVHGNKIKQSSWLFRIGKSTMYKIVPEVCQALFTVLRDTYLKFPDEDDWLDIAEDFQNIWNMPNCVGSIDGKHIRIKAPPNSGSLFRNYKQFFSINLMAMCDAHQRFIWVNVGDYGCLNDASIFQSSDLGQSLEAGEIYFPATNVLPGTDVLSPYYIVGDAGFPLKAYLMRPFSRGANFGNRERIFNYRLSRARRIVECAFGTLSTKRHIFQSPLSWKIDHTEAIVMALICIHNFLITSELQGGQQRYLNENINYNDDDQENNDRHEVHNNYAVQIRNILADYFISPQGSVPWQEQHLFGL